MLRNGLAIIMVLFPLMAAADDDIYNFDWSFDNEEVEIQPDWKLMMGDEKQLEPKEFWATVLPEVKLDDLYLLESPDDEYYRDLSIEEQERRITESLADPWDGQLVPPVLEPTENNLQIGEGEGTENAELTYAMKIAE